MCYFPIVRLGWDFPTPVACVPFSVFSMKIIIRVSLHELPRSALYCKVGNDICTS